MNCQKKWNIDCNKHYYYTYIKHKLAERHNIKKPFLLTTDSNSACDKGVCLQFVN